jgi:hypothetical protein
MAVTVYPHSMAASVGAAPVGVEQGAKWQAAAAGNLQVSDQNDVLLAEFAAGQWSYVEKT